MAQAQRANCQENDDPRDRLPIKGIPLHRKYGEEQDYDEAKDNELSFAESEELNED